jgi:hypothetical protein
VESRIVDILIQLEGALRDRTPPVPLRPCDHRMQSESNPLRAYFLIGLDAPREQCPELAQLVGARIDFGAFSRWTQMTPTTHLSVDVMGDIAGILADAEKRGKNKDVGEVGVFQPILLADGAEQMLDVHVPEDEYAQTGIIMRSKKKGGG